MTSSDTLNPGDIITLPVLPGDGPGEKITFEVEKVGDTHVILIYLHTNGGRVKTHRGHFARSTRSRESIAADLG